MEPIRHISKIDRQLRVLSEVWEGKMDKQYLLRLTLMYQDHNMGRLDFTLNGYGEPDVANLAQNIQSNDYLMREIDDYLSGEIE
ncbi:MAG TPA: hypothetical protein PKD17_17075 [Cellvibrionaceae bacterium]|nr:hypothetical protein [Cellvibrionaceae bacterium]HMW73543.1 hypothetical protein [Cellvibrionaceae bacterium]